MLAGAAGSPLIAEVNGQPSVLTYQDGVLLSVLSLDIAEGQVRWIFIIGDPQKLTRLDALRFER